MTNEETISEGDRRLGRLAGAMERLTARKTGRIQSGKVQDAASQSISGSLAARSANAADKPGLAGALQRAQKQNILRDSGLSNPAAIKPQFGMANGLQQADARGIVARQTVHGLRQGYTVNRLQASTGGAEHKIVLAGGPPKRRVVQVGSDVSDQISLGRYTGTLATRQRDKKEIQGAKRANSVNLFRGREIVTDEFHGNYMKNEEYTQVLEQMILSLTGMELEELHEAVGSHLSEDWQTAAHWKATNKKNKKAALAVMKKKFPHLNPMAVDGNGRLYHRYIPKELETAQGTELRSNTVYGTGSKPVPAPTTPAGMKKLHPKLRRDDPFYKTTFVPKPGGKLGTKSTFNWYNPRYVAD